MVPVRCSSIAASRWIASRVRTSTGSSLEVRWIVASVIGVRRTGGEDPVDGGFRMFPSGEAAELDDQDGARPPRVVASEDLADLFGVGFGEQRLAERGGVQVHAGDQYGRSASSSRSVVPAG